MNNYLEIPEREDILSTVEKIKKREISVEGLVREHLDLAQKINPQINAFISILEEEAITKARNLDREIQSGNSDILKKKLLGIPYTVKDLYLVKNTKTTFASRYMEDFVATYTSTVVEKCDMEGAILIGKCNCDPWGFGGSGENSGFGPTKHPLDFSRTPGGSSSGSAASLLSGVGYFSLGTDTGGSVRLPASFCGLYGFKPTFGRNSRYGIGAMGSSFDTPGFFTRFKEDIRLLEEIMEGRDQFDATTFDFSNSDTKWNKPASELKIGIAKEFFTDGIDPEVRSLLDKFVSKISDSFFVDRNLSIPSIKYGLGVYYILVPSEISSNRARYDGVRFGPFVSDKYEENLVNGRSQFLEREVKRRVMIGTYALSSGYADQYYKKATEVRQKLKLEFQSAFSNFDLLIAPVSPTTAFRLGEKANDPVQMYLVDIFTVIANLVGIPSISIPIGEDSKGLPVGVQIMADNFAEEKIYSFLETL